MKLCLKINYQIMYVIRPCNSISNDDYDHHKQLLHNVMVITVFMNCYLSDESRE